MRNDIAIENVSFDTQARVIVFEIDNKTFCNTYLVAGTDSASVMENYCSEVLPNLLVNSGKAGYIGRDFNCITE